MWSDELQEETREYFNRMPFAFVKQIGGKGGVCTLKDGIYIIIDREDDSEVVFESMDALIEANWAID